MIRPDRAKQSFGPSSAEELDLADGETDRARGRTRSVGRDRRGHRHGRRDAGPPAGPLRPHGAVRRKRALDIARDCQEPFALRCPNWPSRWRRRSPEAYYDALARAGRSTDEIEDISGRFPQRFVPFIGSGTGGSSALYGMVCERFFVHDFTPRQNFRDPGDSTVPEAWPVSYDQMRALVRGGRKATGGSRPARSPAAGGGRGRSACGAAVFRRQPAAGRLSNRSRSASLSPADGL